MIMVGNLLKLLHILAAFALIGGEIGRTIAFQRAKKATDIKVVAEMLQLFTFFTSKFVSAGGMATFLLGLFTAGAQGGAVLILGFLLGGSINWVLAAIILYIIVMAMVFSIAVPRGKVIGQALGAAMGQGRITPELTAALNDSALNTNFIIQDVLILLIVVLMVLKPF
jgi:uncharacterized membrane protein